METAVKVAEEPDGRETSKHGAERKGTEPLYQMQEQNKSRGDNCIQTIRSGAGALDVQW